MSNFTVISCHLQYTHVEGWSPGVGALWSEPYTPVIIEGINVFDAKLIKWLGTHTDVRMKVISINQVYMCACVCVCVCVRP